MKLAKSMRLLITVGVTVAFAFALTACANNGSTSSSVAATINGTEIAESQVTDTIQNVRAQSGLETEEAWGQFLASNDMTPQSVREQIIDTLINQELVKTGAAELEITVDSAEVDSYVESMRANFDSDEAWAEALTQAGFTEDEYRASIEESLIQQGVSSHFEEQAEVSDEDILESAKMYASYYDGAKRSSHILFAAEDEATASEVLARIKSGDLDFAEAAKQYSTDSSAENGGDVGWDRATSFVTAYQEALDALEVDQVSDLVTSDFGIHIIKCTEIYHAPEEVTSIEDIPEAFRETITNQAKSVAASDAYQKWIDELREKSDITINDMPSNVPYNVDVEKYKTEETSGESESTEGAEGAESASAEAASTEAADASAESASAESASADAASAEAADASASAESASAESANS